MAPFIDFYKLLGVPRGATTQDINKVFRKLSLLHHPDKLPEDKKVAGEAHFKELNTVRTTLIDATSRAQYDSTWHQAKCQMKKERERRRREQENRERAQQRAERERERRRQEREERERRHQEERDNVKSAEQQSNSNPQAYTQPQPSPQAAFYPYAQYDHYQARWFADERWHRYQMRWHAAQAKYAQGHSSIGEWQWEHGIYWTEYHIYFSTYPPIHPAAFFPSTHPMSMPVYHDHSMPGQFVASDQKSPRSAPQDRDPPPYGNGPTHPQANNSDPTPAPLLKQAFKFKPPVTPQTFKMPGMPPAGDERDFGPLSKEWTIPSRPTKRKGEDEQSADETQAKKPRPEEPGEREPRPY